MRNRLREWLFGLDNRVKQVVLPEILSVFAECRCTSTSDILPKIDSNYIVERRGGEFVHTVCGSVCTPPPHECPRDESYELNP